jgi:hypothetical protein
MYLIQLLMPLYDNEGVPFPPDLHERVRDELTARFGGITAFTRAPAEGRWKSDGKSSRDDIVVYEIMTEELAPEWWRDYRRGLERLFRQDVIVVRSQEIQLL